MKALGRYVFNRDDGQFGCAHRGQVGEIWRILPNGSLYSILSCGHPYTLDPKDEGSLVTIEWFERPPEVKEVAKPITIDKPRGKRGKKKEENEMARKAATIANSKGVIPVQGYDAEVDSFRTNMTFSKQLEAVIDTQKNRFRELAEEMLAHVEGPAQRVEFIAKSGAVVPVTFSDPEKDGNRLHIKDDLISECLKLGVDAAELGVLEVSHTYTLSGAFVAWMDEMIALNYTAKGLEIPEGITKKSVTKISVEGVQVLTELAQKAPTEKEREAAAALLKGGIKAPAVTAK